MTPKEQVVITDAGAAAAVCHLKFASYLGPFMRSPTSLSVAARELGVPLNVLHYWIQKFEAWGLVRVNHVQTRKGRPIKVYEATAYQFIVPPELISEQHADQAERYWQTTFRAALDSSAPILRRMGGLALALGADNQLNVTRIDPEWMNWDPLEETHPAVLSTWSEGLILTDLDAKELQRRLFSVFQAFQKRSQSDGKGRRYVLYLAMAPNDN